MSGAGIVSRPIVQPSLGSTVALVTPARRPSTLLADGVAGILRKVLRQTLRPETSPSRRPKVADNLKHRAKGRA
jgi:hypothetical protein